MNRIALSFVALLISAVAAVAQPSGGGGPGPQPTNPWIVSGSTMNPNGLKVITAATKAAQAGFNLPHGVAPTVPVNGDMWTTTAGFFARINGATVGPFIGGGSGSFAATAPLAVSFPAGITTYALNFNASLVNSGGNLGINLANSNTFTAAQAINLNAASLPTRITGTGFLVGAADGVVGRIQIDSFGAISAFTGAVYGGTAASPTAVTSGTQLTGVNAYAYNGAALVGPIASFRTYAAENIASGHQGAKACIGTTAIASTTLTDNLCVGNDGALTITNDIVGPGAGFRVSRQAGFGGLVFDSANNITQAVGIFASANGYQVGTTTTTTITGNNVGLTFSGGAVVPLYVGNDGLGSGIVSMAAVLSWGSGTPTQSSGDLFLARKAAASLQIGGNDAVAPLPQTFRAQSVLAGTSNTSGVAFSIMDSAGTGTGFGGGLFFYSTPAGSTGSIQGTPLLALSIGGVTNGAHNAAAFTGSVKIASSVTVGSGTAITSGGSSVGLLLSSTASFGMVGGAGAPTLGGAKGSIYLDNTGGIPYYNNNGTTGWTALAAAGASVTCAQLPALTGDVTTSAGACPTTIAANAVTYAKFQTVFANGLVGNPTGSLATTQGIAIGATLQFTGAPALQTVAMTGDITTSANSFATTLATVNSNVGTFGSATQSVQFTVNGKGLITAAANVTVTPAVGSITGLGTGVATALGVNVGSAGAFVTFNGAGGTPSSMTGTNITGIPGAGVATAANASGSPSATFGVVKCDGTTITCSSGVITAVGAVAASIDAGGATSISNGTNGRFLSQQSGNVAELATLTGSTTAITVVSASLVTSGNISAAAWTTSGIRFKASAASYTDTSSSGTVAVAYTDFHGAGTILASSSTTYTNYFGIYFQDPVASTNVTMTNKWAGGFDSLKVGTSNQLTISTTGVLSATNAAFTTPSLGAATATSINGNTFTTGTYTLTGTAGKTLTFNNSITLAGTDATTWTGPSTNATLAALNIADQTLTGGANVTSLSQSTGSITVDCGARPLQYITNGGAYTITAPSNDGSCMLLVTNNGSAGATTFTGFTVGSSTGDALTTTNTNKFTITIWRINGTSSYLVKALQ